MPYVVLKINKLLNKIFDFFTHFQTEFFVMTLLLEVEKNLKFEVGIKKL